MPSCRDGAHQTPSSARAGITPRRRGRRPYPCQHPIRLRKIAARLDFLTARARVASGFAHDRRVP
jgi:hypothetical protein